MPSSSNKHVKVTSVSTAKVAELHDKLVGKKPFMLVVHADWCIHCKHLMEPQGGKSSVWSQFLASNKDVNVVEVEYTQFEDIVKTHEKTLLAKVMRKSVQGFPAIMCVSEVQDGEINVYTFNGKRDAKSLSVFAKKYLKA